ncbi:MAG: shikimate dehydrogenase [Ardenticatenaceae bacterium]|nr:shikimate dehydrogenase [Ardenticatenaceae bacterium]MCB9442867.1 shikimate dehydrogenase [Ardenticatenaceae bacterium]
MAQINGSTTLIGLIGWPVTHSFSPAMHNAAAVAAGLDYVYVPLPVRPEDVVTAVPALPTLGFRGVNVTIPHKQAVMPLLDEIDPAAAAIGAVNTIVVETRRLGTVDYPTTRLQDYKTTGYNTDWSGFLADLAALGVPVAGRDCLVLGAGGSARAAAYGLASAGGQVQVLARRSEQARQLVTDLTPCLRSITHEGWLTSWPLVELKTAVAATTAPLIINTTPLGMSPQVDASPWPDALPFPAGAFVYDLVYNPRQTRLMQQAQNAGCGTANGLGMLVQQGALAFQLWTGVMPDVEIMKAEIRR